MVRGVYTVAVREGRGRRGGGVIFWVCRECMWGVLAVGVGTGYIRMGPGKGAIMARFCFARADLGGWGWGGCTLCTEHGGRLDPCGLHVVKSVWRFGLAETAISTGQQQPRFGFLTHSSGSSHRSTAYIVQYPTLLSTLRQCTAINAVDYSRFCYAPFSREPARGHTYARVQRILDASFESEIHDGGHPVHALQLEPLLAPCLPPFSPRGPGSHSDRVRVFWLPVC